MLVKHIFANIFVYDVITSLTLHSLLSPDDAITTPPFISKIVSLIRVFIKTSHVLFFAPYSDQ